MNQDTLNKIKSYNFNLQGNKKQKDFHCQRLN